MQLNQEQQSVVASWISEGLTLAQIQHRLGTELGVRMTYMEARMLVDDLKLLPKETLVSEPAKPVEPEMGGPTAPLEGGEEAKPAAAGEVRVKVDTLTRPGAMVSGSVTFSDGEVAQWYLDQVGRMGMVPPSPGYRPPQQDIPTFQMLLENELSKLGM